MLSRAQNTFHHNPRLRGPVSSNYQFLCVLRSKNILVLFLLRHLNRFDRYSTMKIGRYFLFEYISSLLVSIL